MFCVSTREGYDILLSSKGTLNTRQLQEKLREVHFVYCYAPG